ncbi:MAG: ribonuclease P protein component [Actinomycetota bacterium]|nr:ribonuclease P protein component [Actinomycetota bacterium]
MLAPVHRLRASADFSQALRRGRRAGRPLLSVHLLVCPDGAPPRVGLVVSKGVGGSVVRHRVSRQLRHLVRSRLEALPTGSRLIVRAAPVAGGASSAALGADLDAALARVTP